MKQIQTHFRNRCNRSHFNENHRSFIICIFYSLCIFTHISCVRSKHGGFSDTSVPSTHKVTETLIADVNFDDIPDTLWLTRPTQQFDVGDFTYIDFRISGVMPYTGEIIGGWDGYTHFIHATVFKDSALLTTLNLIPSKYLFIPQISHNQRLICFYTHISAQVTFDKLWIFSPKSGRLINNVDKQNLLYDLVDLNQDDIKELVLSPCYLSPKNEDIGQICPFEVYEYKNDSLVYNLKLSNAYNYNHYKKSVDVDLLAFAEKRGIRNFDLIKEHIQKGYDDEVFAEKSFIENEGVGVVYLDVEQSKHFSFYENSLNTKKNRDIIFWDTEGEIEHIFNVLTNTIGYYPDAGFIYLKCFEKKGDSYSVSYVDTCSLWINATDNVTFKAWPDFIRGLDLVEPIYISLNPVRRTPDKNGKPLWEFYGDKLPPIAIEKYWIKIDPGVTDNPLLYPPGWIQWRDEHRLLIWPGFNP